MVYCCFISNSSPSPQIQTWQDEVLFQRLLFKRLWVETKPSGMLFMNRFFFWPRMEIAKVAFLVFVLCNSFFERRKLECEVYTLLFSLYNPQQKVTTYSYRKWIEAKNRNKLIRSLLIITRHFSLRANYLKDEIDSDISNDVAMCGTQDTQDTDLLPFFQLFFQKRESLTHDRRSSDIVLVIIPFYTNHNWTTTRQGYLSLPAWNRFSF